MSFRTVCGKWLQGVRKRYGQELVGHGSRELPRERGTGACAATCLPCCALVSLGKKKKVINGAV